MAASRALFITLGALALAGASAINTFDVIFAVTIPQKSSLAGTRTTAIVASALASLTLVLLFLLLVRHIGYQNKDHIQDFGLGRQHTYLLAGFTGVFGLLSAAASAVLLAIMKNGVLNLPQRTMNASTQSLVVGAFIAWAVALAFQTVFTLCMVIKQRKDFHKHIQQYRPETRQPVSKIEEVGQTAPDLQDNTIESKSLQSSNGRSRANSDTISSLRSSLSQVVRPVTSKSRLISPKSPYRPTSGDSSCRDTVVSIEEGFDSWDTSAVDPSSRKTVESFSPTPQQSQFTDIQPRFLETIPASPTTSRSPSPGFPLDLEPPKTRKRSRSYSPANSFKEIPRTRTTSPTESAKEAHIHPLFRTDSVAPPPAATPGTIVTAAPGAGQVISDRASIRSLKRMRSGSLPSTPLTHSGSLDSIRQSIEREEQEKSEERSERSLTPPIPDWILQSGQRNSLAGYSMRKKPGLGKLGEERDT
jgi:hypothetical protein